MKTKRTILLSMLFATIFNITFAQQLNYDDVTKGAVPKGKYESYLSKDGSVYKIGDTLTIGLPSGTNGMFVSINKVDIMGTAYIVGREAINTSAEIKKIRITGNKRIGYKANFQTKGLTGIDNYFFNIEDAIELGEVKSFGKSSDEALEELKKAKDKLDLGLITQEEYDKLKEDLSKYIK
jgi:hypothetical protein